MYFWWDLAGIGGVRGEGTYDSDVAIDDTRDDDSWEGDSVCDFSQDRASASQGWRAYAIAGKAVDDYCCDGVQDCVGDLEGEEGLERVLGVCRVMKGG